jgi:hypothetical protein
VIDSIVLTSRASRSSRSPVFTPSSTSTALSRVSRKLGLSAQREGAVEARLGMGAGKEVSSMGGTASTLFELESWWRGVVLDRVR